MFGSPGTWRVPQGNGIMGRGMIVDDHVFTDGALRSVTRIRFAKITSCNVEKAVMERCESVSASASVSAPVSTSRERPFVNILTRCKYLPSTSEVWGKVMFLHLCVILFTGGKGVCPTPPPIGRPEGGWPDPPDADPPGCRPPGCRPTPDTSTSGQYASYWNAFFLRYTLQELQ